MRGLGTSCNNVKETLLPEFRSSYLNICFNLGGEWKKSFAKSVPINFKKSTKRAFLIKQIMNPDIEGTYFLS